jgi:hypothetical protein
MQVDVARVRVEHEALDHEAAELQSLIMEGPSSCSDAFARLAAYASILSEHLLGEHDVLEVAHRGREGSPQFGRMRTDLEALRWDWEEYLSIWTEDTASQDWETFSEHSLVLLDRIRRRIRHEDELLNAAAPYFHRTC